MNLQYISDSKGKTTGVFIPIQDWEALKKEIAELRERAEAMEIPEWHKEIVRQRMKDYLENPDQVMDWEEVQNKFNLDK